MKAATWIIGITLALVAACTSEEKEPKPPPFTCADGLSVDAPACVPELDPCTKEACGVVTCPDGFGPRGTGGCTAILAADGCEAGSSEVLGETGCRELDACGTGTFGDIPDAPGTAYVDANAIAPFDGTRAHPFRTIEEARVTKPASIALAEGRYDQELVFDAPIELRGRCSKLVTVRSVGTNTAGHVLTFLADARVRGIAMTGPGGAISAKASLTAENIDLYGVRSGISFFPTSAGATLKVSGSRIDGVRSFGIAGRGKMLIERTGIGDVSLTSSEPAFGVRVTSDAIAAGDLTLDHVFIYRVRGVGVDVDGTAKLASVLVRDTTSVPGRGAAIEVHPRSKVSLLGVVVERPSAARAVVIEDSDVAIDNLTVHDVQPVEKLGAGVAVLGNSVVSMTHAHIERAVSAGLLVEGGDVRVSNSRMIRSAGSGLFARGPRTFALKVSSSAFDDNVGDGITIDGDKPTTIEGCALEANGISVISGSARIASTVVEGGSIRVAPLPGTLAPEMPHLDLERSIVRGGIGVGVRVVDATAKISDSTIEDVAPGAPNNGTGVFAESIRATALLTVERARIARVQTAGVLGLGAELTLNRVLVRGVFQPSPQSGDGLVTIGKGSWVGKASVNLCRVEAAPRAGVAMFGTSASVTLTAIDCARDPIAVENQRYPFERDASFHDGGGNSCGCGAAGKCTFTARGLPPTKFD